jgi:rhodanese-related sulfurtransferase
MMTPEKLYAQLGLPDAPLVVDVRSGAERERSPVLIPGAVCGAPEQIATWSASLPRTRTIVTFGGDDEEHARTTAVALAALGYPASPLEGGLAAWLAQRHPTITVRRELRVPGGSRWVTRERPKIDRLACPWLIRRFIDPYALFFYVPAHRVRAEAEALGAEPYDIADVRFSHRGPRCSFDAFLDEFGLDDPAVNALADIVRAADTARLEQSREAPGLLAVSLGLSAMIADDLLLLEQAMPLYDALYVWCKIAHDETHSWPQQTAAG